MLNNSEMKHSPWQDSSNIDSNLPKGGEDKGKALSHGKGFCPFCRSRYFLPENTVVVFTSSPWV